MEDIKIGEYVRTKQGNIFIYDDGEETEKILAKEIRIGTVCIVKHSHNIIDLIEVGDYVNGKEIIEISYFNNQLYFYTNYCPQTVISESDLTNKIRTILTKEQYKSMAYKVEEE